MDARDAYSTSPVRAYYIGSGRIGVPVLETLHDSPHIELCGVATQPDRPSGRHRVPTPTPVSGWCTAHATAVAKPASVNDASFLSALADRSPEVVVVFSFGQILKADLLSLPPRGCLNIHTSLLPRHRGAAPIAAAILAGDAETGVCFMAMEKGLDTGPVYDCVRTPLDGTETSASLTDRLSALAAAHVVGILHRVCREGVRPTPQPDVGATYAGQLRKSDARMDWREPAERLERQIRAYIPWPRSWFVLPTRKRERRIQVLDGTPLPSTEPTGARAPAPGQVLDTAPGELRIACGAGSLRLNSLVPEGRNPMTGAEFLRGTRIESGTVLPSPDVCT